MTQFHDFCDRNEQQISSLARKFGSYVLTIEETQIRNWLKQFGEDNISNLELGLKLLNKVDYFSPPRIVREARELHQTFLEYKNMNIQNLLNKPTYFVDFSLSSGHSQDEFIPKYRFTSELRHVKYDKYFIYLRDIGKFFDKQGIMLVFLTDFIGSGKQVADIWKDNLWAISSENEHILLSICGYRTGVDKIREETGDQLCTLTNRLYGNENRFFADENTSFSPTEKEVLKELCERAGEFPTGYEDTQSTTVFYFRCPNNVISILRANNRNWAGLFKRYSD